MQTTKYNITEDPSNKNRTTHSQSNLVFTMLSRLRHAFKFFTQQFEAEQGILLVSIKRNVGVIQGPIVYLFQRAAQIVNAMKKHKVNEFNLRLGK